MNPHEKGITVIMGDLVSYLTGDQQHGTAHMLLLAEALSRTTGGELRSGLEGSLKLLLWPGFPETAKTSPMLLCWDRPSSEAAYPSRSWKERYRDKSSGGSEGTYLRTSSSHALSFP